MSFTAKLARAFLIVMSMPYIKTLSKLWSAARLHSPPIRRPGTFCHFSIRQPSCFFGFIKSNQPFHIACVGSEHNETHQILGVQSGFVR